jgi:hypothetical protein
VTGSIVNPVHLSLVRNSADGRVSDLWPLQALLWCTCSGRLGGSCGVTGPP